MVTSKAKENEIIVGLVEHAKTGGDCFGCPYQKEAFCHHKLCKDAIELLKAQEPVKPQEYKGNYFCECGNRLHKCIETDKYCSRCGRAVKWE